MHTYVALLRAVNLGAAGRIAMSRLRELATAAGGSHVRTYLTSGNVVLCAEYAREQQVAAALREQLRADGTDVEVTVRRGADVVALVEHGHPFAGPGVPSSALQVAFGWQPVSRELVATMPSPGGEQAAWCQGEVLLHFPHGVGRSKLTTARLQRHLGTVVTCRNWRTVSTLAQWAAQQG